jgi:hypothetical protein
MKVGIAVFVKTPGRSPVKTRLAQHVGPERAAECHVRCAEAVREALAAAPSLVPYWAVAEHGALDAWQGFEVLAQGDGSLGARMARVHAALRARHGAALLVGADAPQLDSAELEQAAEWLVAPESRLVLGRARDGGFWLFGANRALPESDWIRVAYSEADTARAFEQAMSRHGRWLHLSERTDLDRGSDIAAVARELEALPAPTPSQRVLAGWLATLDRPMRTATR